MLCFALESTDRYGVSSLDDYPYDVARASCCEHCDETDQFPQIYMYAPSYRPCLLLPNVFFLSGSQLNVHMHL
jgi:hypothetical protein